MNGWDLYFIIMLILLFVVFMFFPKKIQNNYIDYCERNKFMGIFLNSVKSKRFIIVTRINSILILIMIIMFILAMIYGVDKYPNK